jgi:hypothetical protein
MKISRRDGLQCRQIYLKLVELCGNDALSYSEVCYWSQQFFIGRESVEDAKRTHRPSDFSIQLRIQSAHEEMPHASVPCITEARYTPATTMFYILTGALCLRFRHWRWVPHLLSDDQKVDRARQIIMLLAALAAAEK